MDLDRLKEEWAREQDTLRTRVVTTDQFDPASLKRVGGVDISFDKKDPTRACAYLVVFDAGTLEPIYEDHEVVTLTIPYIAGFLGFREVPHYLTLLDRLRRTQPEHTPDVILVDGFGTLHHRGFGSACHLGVMGNIPALGCAKTLMCLDGLDEKKTKTAFKDPTVETLDLIGDSGTVHGVAVRSPGTTNPIYVSVGHGVSLKTAVDVVKRVSKYRVPEPIRLADIRSKTFL